MQGAAAAAEAASSLLAHTTALGSDTGRNMRTHNQERRTRSVPREHLIGAHRGRREPERDHRPDEPGWAEPVGGGSDVAPTRQAEERERERHHLQRAEGVTPAGDDSPRQRRTPKATRQRLDAAARAADESISAARRRH